MPANNGLRLNEDQCLFPSRPEPLQYHPEPFIRNGKVRMRGLSLQNRKLLAKSQIFEEQVAAGTGRSGKQNEQKPQQAGHESVVAERQGVSTVGFASVPDANNFDGGFVSELKEEPIITAPKAETGLGRLEHLHVAVPCSEVSAGAVENV